MILFLILNIMMWHREVMIRVACAFVHIQQEMKPVAQVDKLLGVTKMKKYKI